MSMSKKAVSTTTAVIVLIFCVLAIPPSGALGEKDHPGPKTNSDTYFKNSDAPYALLWMANSAEYEAICLQTYNMAQAYVAAEVDRRAGKETGKPLAVVMDLDEAVLNNLAYMTYLRQAGQGVSWDQWGHFEKHHGKDVTLVPGALDFIRAAEKMGVTVCFVSNRETPNRKYTIDTLVRLGVAGNAGDLTGDNAVRLLLYNGSSDKNPRRALIEDMFDVIAYLGDSLGDFPGGFTAGSADGRSKQVRAKSEKWGAGWFILPNPTYGAWLKYIDSQEPEKHLPKPTYESEDCPLKK